MNAYSENDLSILAALLVLAAALGNPLLGAALAGLFLGVSTVLHIPAGD